MIQGKTYKVRYRVDKRLWEGVLTFLAQEDDNLYIFSGRPEFGTVELENVIEVEEVPASSKHFIKRVTKNAS